MAKTIAAETLKMHTREIREKEMRPATSLSRLGAFVRIRKEWDAFNDPTRHLFSRFEAVTCHTL
jgi:hypothetical protein